MNDISLNEYKNKVNDLGQVLLDVIASVSLGDFNVSIDIPEDIEVFADLAVGLEFMIEDLKELNLEQERSRAELEQRISQRTRELEEALNNLKSSQSHLVKEGWEDYLKNKPDQNQGLILEGGQISFNPEVILPSMEKAIQFGQTSIETNGQNKQTLSLPIHLQEQIIGVIGFDRPGADPLSDREIATVEAIIEQLGLALENQRLFDQTQSTLAESESLYQASAELNIAQSYSDILKVLQQYTLLGQTAHTLSIQYFDTAWSKNQTPEWENILGSISNKGIIFDERQKLNTGWVNLLIPGEPTFVNDVKNDHRLEDSLRLWLSEDLKATSSVHLPLVVGGSWVGYLNLLYDRSYSFTEEDVRRTTAIAAQVSVAVQNLRSVDLAEQRAKESQQRSEELATVNRVVSSVASSMDLNEGLEIVAQELNNAVSVDEVGIALLNENNTHLTVVADSVRKQGVTSSVGTVIPVKGNLSTTQAIETRKPVMVTQAQSNPKTAMVHQVMETRHYNTLYIFPLVAGTEVIGTVGLTLYSEDARLSDDEIRLAETIVLQASTAIQNSRLFAQTQSALTETANLYQASAELNTVQSFDDILSVLRRYSILGVNSNYISINLFDRAWFRDNIPESLIPAAQWAKTGAPDPEAFPTTLSTWGHAKDLMNIDRLTVVGSLENDPRAEGVVRDFFRNYLNAEGLLTIPLVSAGQWIGQIIATIDSQTALLDADTRRLLSLSGQAAVAIQNIRLLEETERRASQLETAADIAREASSTLNTETLLNNAVNLIRERFGFYHASIFLREGKFAVVAASTGEAGRQLVENKHSLPIQEGKSIIGTVTHTGEALVVNDVTQDPTHRPHPLLPDTRAELGIPMIVGNRITGAMDVQSTRTNAFSEDDIAVLRTLADQIAVAVENARSFELAQDAVDEMREIDRIKSEFLANMSHELRTPLNSIIGFSRVILKGIDGPINELQQQDLEAIHNSGQHLLDMINNILDLSKIEAGKMELSIEEIELKDIFDGVISTARGLVKEKNLQLLDNTGDSLPTVLADRTRVRQILLNLLQNATKFTDEGKIEVNFETITDQDSGMELGQISVTDSGIGISQEDQEKLFERFSQVDSSLTRKVGGSGLGLSITQHLVEMQGGKIWLKSKEGEGSTFYFTLPIANPTTGIKVQQPEVITGDKIIVSIDDDSKVIDLYKRYLNTHGYQVVAITNPQEALTQIKQIKPHAITVDIMMPSRDGWQVIGDIKSDPATQNIPIIICSIVDDQERGFNLGAADYLVKPILEDEFVTTIKSLKLNGDSAQNNILIIDDDPNILQLVEKAVRNDPSLRFKFAQGGVKGLNSIRQERPDAVLLDLFMPDLDGFSVLETLKSDIELKEIPIIILTSAELGDEERQRIEQYKQEFLQKDGLQDEDLVACLHRALQKINKG